MTRVKKVLAMVAITAFIAVMPLAAQSIVTAPFELESNTLLGTAGLYTSDVDDALDVHDWSGVEFEKSFGFITGEYLNWYDQEALNGSAGWHGSPFVSIGYATNLGGIYFGLWYKGNVLGITGWDTETKVTWASDNTVTQGQDQITTRTYYSEAWINHTNQIEVLLGVAGMGIKLGFFESMSSDKNPASSTGYIEEIDYRDGRKSYENEVVEYELSRSLMRPSLGWGMSLMEGSLLPYVNLALDMYSDKRIDNTQDYSTFNGVRQGDSSTTIGAGNNNGYLRPDLAVGATFIMEREASTIAVGLEYGMSLKIFDNDYSASGFSGSAKGPVSWTGGASTVTNSIDGVRKSNSTTLEFSDTTEMTHRITPSMSIKGEPAEALKVGFRASLPVSLTLTSEDNYEEIRTFSSFVSAAGNKGSDTTTNIVQRDNYGLAETTELDIAVNLGLGVTYQLVPDRFTINAGINASPARYIARTVKNSPNGVDQITTTTTTNGYGETTVDDVDINAWYGADSVTFTPNWHFFNASLAAGFTFYFTPTAALELLASTWDSEFNANIANVNVLFTMKF